MQRVLLSAAFAVLLSATALADSSDKIWAEKILKGLTLREKIAQLIQIRVPGKFLNRQSSDFLEIEEQIRREHVGGVVLFAGNVYESAILLNDLQAASKLPLLVAADFERGASFRIADTTSFPWAMALGATGSEQLAYQQGLITARESRALGVHWIFAPVMDVNNNPNNPVINIRSFGEDPALVSRLGVAFIRGAKKGGVLTTAKHFPGHGDTSTDSHLGLAVIQSDMARLQSVELAPFRSAIEAGVDAIMTAHIAVPRVTGQPEVPATLSPAILTDLLHNSLKFNGLVITDALEMAAITSHYWCGLAAVRALQAGADIILLPPNEMVAISEVERAVRRGDLSESRINASVRKILLAKGGLGLRRTRTVSIRQIGKVIAAPQSVGLAQEIADRSITVPRDVQHLLPVNPAGETRIFSLVLASDLESSPGTVFQTEMRRRFPAIRTAWGNARIPNEQLGNIEKAISESDLIVLSTLVRLVSGQDALSIPESHRAILEKLVAAHKPVIWIVFGSPYVLRLAPQIGTCVCAFSYSDVSQVAAAKALAGEIEISGRMPVSVSEISKVGDGLTIARLQMILKPASHEELSTWQKAFEKTSRLVASLVENREIPGAELIVGRNSSVMLDMAIGKAGDAGNSGDVSPNTVYDLDSLSGVVGTSSAAMLAADSGNLILDAPVKDYIPELGQTDVARLPAQKLFVAMKDTGNFDTEEINEAEDIWQKIVSRTTGIGFERFLEERLFEPLGMKDTFFNRPKDSRRSVALSGNSRRAKLFSTSRDVAVFAQMLLNRGVYNHHRFFKPEMIARFSGADGPWSKPSDSSWTGKTFSPSAFGYNSASGSFLWIDPAKNLFIVFLTNSAQNTERLQEIQKELSESIVAAISSL